MQKIENFAYRFPLLLIGAGQISIVGQFPIVGSPCKADRQPLLAASKGGYSGRLRTQRMVKVTMGGQQEGHNGWLRTQRMVKDTTDG